MTNFIKMLLAMSLVSVISACAKGGDAEGDGDGGSATNTVTVSPEVGDLNL